MKRISLLYLAAFFSFEVIANESLDSLPCYCVNLVEIMGGNAETELSEEDIKALEEDNIYFSDRKGCLAKFLVPVKPINQPKRPNEKPLPMYVAQKLGLWGYNHMGYNSVATSYAAGAAHCYTTRMGRELYAKMQNDTALARPFFNYIYEYYYGSRNAQIRVNSLADMGFTYAEIDQMEEIGYVHYKVLEYERKHPSLSRKDLIKEGFEAERALETQEIKIEELDQNPYYTEKLGFDSLSGIEHLRQYFSECTVASISPCKSKILVHVDKKGRASMDCNEVDDALAKHLCDYISKNCELKYKPAYLVFPSIEAKVRVPCTSYINIIERRDFDRIAVVQVVFKNNQWDFVPDTQLSGEWNLDDMINSIRMQLSNDKTKKKKLTLHVQLIRRKMLVDHLGECQLGSLYQIVSSNDKKLQFEQYNPSYIRW